MRCSRCQSFMVKDHLYDLLENDGQVYVGGWQWGHRCPGCGWVVLSVQKQDEASKQPAAIECAQAGLQETMISRRHP